MQNQFEINEKEIEKEIEEERLKCARYSVIESESYIPIYKKDLEKLKKSNLLSTPFKTRKPPNQINLIFEMLFNEILLIILSYLSPGEIILFSLTCKQAEYICSDYLLWKQIAIKFQDYFTWNSVFVSIYYDYPNIELKGIQFKIQQKNRNDPKQKQIKELSKTNEKIKNYFDNSNSTKRIGYRFYKSNFISIKSERIIYIENLKNPKQEIEKKGKMIFKELRKTKEKFIYSQKRITYSYNSIKYLLDDLIYSMNGIILITTLIILNIYIDLGKSISIPKLFLLSEIDLLITIFWIIYSKITFYSIQDYFMYLYLIITGLIFMIMISLKTRFNFIPWLIVLLPLIVLFIYFIYQLFKEFKTNPYDKMITSMFIIGLIYLIIAILFIGLKLDGFIEIKYSKLIYLLIIIEIYILYSNKKQFENFAEFIGFFLFFLSSFIILSFLFLYGDGIIKKFWHSLIPLYVILMILYFFSFIRFYSSFFKLISK